MHCNDVAQGSFLNYYLLSFWWKSNICFHEIHYVKSVEIRDRRFRVSIPNLSRQLKNVDGWRLNLMMKSIVSVRSISCATTKAMKHHVLGCLEDESPDTILLHHGTNDLRSEESAEMMVSNIINVALSAKNKKVLFLFQD